MIHQQKPRSVIEEIPHYWDVKSFSLLTIAKLLDNQDQERALRRMRLFQKLRLAH